jgi:hypothetical protein
MKKYGIILDFKDKMITIDEVKLPMQNINYLQGSSTLRALRLNSLSAMDGRDHPLLNQLHSTVVSRQIFIRSQRLIAH